MMQYSYRYHSELREELRDYLKKLRHKAKIETQRDGKLFKNVVFTETRKGFYQNEYVNRLVLFLRGTGCSLARETGGCTFCGFYNATNFGEKVSDDDYLAQITDVINDADVNIAQYPIICLYNDGSMLRDEEISFTTLIRIIQMLNKQETVKKIVIESRVEDITADKLRKIRMETKKEIEIAVGFESANPVIRDICINKNFENSVFEANCQVARENQISVVPLVMLKPPFLTENEAMRDYIETLQYLEQFNLRRIDMELPTVESHTLVHDLWRRDMYRPAWLWSVIEILYIRDSLKLLTPIYISPMVYSVSAVVKAFNCPSCDERIYQAFEEYNRCGDRSVFNEINCSCKSDWDKVRQTDIREEELHVRVEKTLHQLNNSCKFQSV